MMSLKRTQASLLRSIYKQPSLRRRSIDRVLKYPSQLHMLVLVVCLALFFIYLISMVYYGHSFCSQLSVVVYSQKFSKCNIIGRNQENDEPMKINQTMVRKLPNCIIVGVRKGGTRALLEFLNIHPQIHKVTDELHFFDDEQKYNLGLDWYRQQMPLVSHLDTVIEKTPAYFITEYVPERIYAMNSSIKIILIVRDPVTRLISDYAQLASNKAKKDLSMPSLEQLIMLPNGRINSNYKGIRTSLYAVYFAKWIKLFSRSQIHVVDGDQFVYDPLPELRKVESFLGVPHIISRDDFTYNITKGFYCIHLDNNGGQRCLNKNKGRKHPEINPLVIRKLRKFYQPYNQYFYKLVGHKFSWPD